MNKALKQQRICAFIQIRKTLEENNKDDMTTTTVLHAYHQYHNYLTPIHQQTTWSNNLLFYPEFQDLVYVVPSTPQTPQQISSSPRDTKKVILINLQKAYRLGFVVSPNLILYENLVKLNVNLKQQQPQQPQQQQQANTSIQLSLPIDDNDDDHKYDYNDNSQEADLEDKKTLDIDKEVELKVKNSINIASTTTTSTNPSGCMQWRSNKDHTIDVANLRRDGTVVKIPKINILDTSTMKDKQRKDYLPCCCFTGGFDCNYTWCEKYNDNDNKCLCNCSYNYNYHQRLLLRKNGCGCIGAVSFSLTILLLFIDGIVHGVIKRDWIKTTSNYETYAAGCNYIAVLAMFYLILSSSVLVLQNTSYAYSDRLITALNYIYLSQLLLIIVPLIRTVISIQNTAIYVLIVTIGYGYFLCYFIFILVLFQRKTNKISKDLNSAVDNLSNRNNSSIQVQMQTLIFHFVISCCTIC